MAIIKAENLTFGYQNAGHLTPVLKGISLAIEHGEMVAIMGPSGSGKSTMFYLLGGLMRPTSGSISIEGHDLAKLSDEELARFRNQKLGFVFQQFHLLARASVHANIMLPTVYNKSILPQARLRAGELAVSLGLEPYLDRMPHQLSGGQQQRVAIARALLFNADIILADEPTGNLDTKNASEVINTLKKLHADGKTVVIITHDRDVAAECERQIVLKDGEIVSDSKARSLQPSPIPNGELSSAEFDFWGSIVQPAVSNLARNKVKSFFTMLGVILGTAAVLAVVSLGDFAKRRILEGYESLGANRLSVGVHSNWRARKTKKTNMPFNGLSWEKDILPLRSVFSQVQYLSPMVSGNPGSVIYGGRAADQRNMMALGVGLHYAAISNIKLNLGRWFTPYHMQDRSPVCVLGHKIHQALAMDRPSLIGEIITITLGEKSSVPCRVIGVMASQPSNKEWFQPDSQILLPFTYLMPNLDYWQSRLENIVVAARDPDDIEELGKGIKNYYEQKFADSANVNVDSDATLLAQMRRFLNIFSLLLAGVAFLCLLVGGIGINNMMIVSVTERLKEIGLRKALGASGQVTRLMVLSESVILSSVAGLIGLVGGFLACGGLVYAGTKLIPNLKFEWILNPWAVVISSGAIVLTGIVSGMIPAMRAEKLSIIEALRAE